MKHHRSTPKVPGSARTRHRSRQRERLLQVLRNSRSHPTAADLHARLRRDFPRLSLGTVYRNLELLQESGDVTLVKSGAGPLRYDANLARHHHFTCVRCGRIEDVELDVADDVGARLAKRYGLEADRVTIDFQGRCMACSRR